MNRTKRFLCLFFMCAWLTTFAQEEQGIQWVENLTWQQIREKAKEESKYIFVDCYTTWCAPCKKMDENVFSKKDVGEFFNEKFISVKIQMDATEKDPESVKAWYKEAIRFEKEYFVSSYPTQLFFNSKGELVDKTTGLQMEDKFLNIARASLQPGKKYEDAYKEFFVLKDKYQKGEKDYKQFPYMISVAKKNGQQDFAQDLVSELHQHLLSLSNKELLNRNYIEFINGYELVNDKNSDYNLSRVFYPDGKKVDALMGRTNYSKVALSEMIRRGYGADFLKGFKGKGANASIPWDSLYNAIAKQFTREIAEQNVLWAKTWYYYSNEDPRALKLFIEFTKSYGVESFFVEPIVRDFYVNNFAWYFCVERSCELNDGRYISALLLKSIEHFAEYARQKHICPNFNYIDTYAVLLHKLGENEKAIKYQQEAIDIYLRCGGGVNGDERHQVMLGQLGQMQNGGIDFTGSWKLNAEKSKFNNTPGAPAAGSKLVVEQKDGTITFQRNERSKESLKIDSTAFIEISDAESKTKVSIKPTPDKQGLIETRIYTYPEGTTSVVAALKVRTWTLSADKKTLTIQDHIETTREGQNYDMLLVYERQ